MRIGYARAKASEVYDPENYATILQVPKVFVDRYGERKQWQELLMYVESDDTVVVQDLHELSNVGPELLEMVQVLAMKGVRLESLNDDLNMDNVTGDIMMAILSLMGQAGGKNNDYYKNGENYSTPETRRQQEVAIDWDRFDYLYPRFKAGEITRIEMYKDLGISRQQLNKILEEYEKESE